MKKLVVIIVAGFLFCIFFGLGMFALVTNTFGINVNTEGLFPTAEIVVLEEALYGTGKTRSWLSFADSDDESIKIINKSGKDLSINMYWYTDPKTVNPAEYNLYSYGVVISELNPNTVEMHSIPDDYDYYFSEGVIEQTNEQFLSVDVNEEKNYDDDTDTEDNREYTYDTITIKDGETYEIKLP